MIASQIDRSEATISDLMCQKIRVFSVVTQLESGGAQTIAVELHREFLRRGIASDLSFLYEKDSSVFPKRDFNTYLTNRPNTPLDFVRIFSQLRKHWTAFRPDVVISHTHFSNNLCAMAKFTGLKAKLLAVHHNPFPTFPASSRFLDYLTRRLELYDDEISVAEQVRASLPPAHIGAKRPVILNGQSLAISALNKTEARASFGLPTETFLIGNVGRLSDQKNQTFLVDLLPKLPGVHLAILGEGHLREPLMQQAVRLGVEDRLLLIGAVIHERVPDFLKALDLFAMPSLFEGMSIAMLEALATGTPFLGSEVPALAEVMNEGREVAGILLPLDSDQWLAQIEVLRADEALRAKLSLRGQERASDFSIELMADKYLSACGSVTGCAS